MQFDLDQSKYNRHQLHVPEQKLDSEAVLDPGKKSAKQILKMHKSILIDVFIECSSLALKIGPVRYATVLPLWNQINHST